MLKREGFSSSFSNFIVYYVYGNFFVAGSMEISLKLIGYYIGITIIMCLVPVVFLKLRKKHELLSNLVPVFAIFVLFYPMSELINMMFTVWKEITDIPYPYINFISWWWE